MIIKDTKLILFLYSWLLLTSLITIKTDTENNTTISSTNTKDKEMAKAQADNLIADQSLTTSKQKDIDVADNFGTAIIKRISNKTDFPMILEIGSTSATSLLGDGAIIRLVSLSNQYGDKHPFIVASEEKLFGQDISNIYLRANGYNASEKICQFIVSNYVDKEGKNFIGLSPLSFKSTRVQVTAKSKDNMLVVSGVDNFLLDDGTSCRWQIEGDLTKCYFKNALTKGYLGPSTETLNTNASDLTSFFNFKNTLLKSVNYIEQEELFSQNAPPQDLQYLFWLYSKKLQEYVFVITDANKKKELNELSTKINNSIKSCKKINKSPIECCYGDCITLKSAISFQDIESHPLNNNKTDNIVCLSNPFWQKAATIDSFLFLIKGEHSETDRYNHNIGQIIKSGDIVRLEHIITSKNLSVSNQKINDSLYIRLQDKDSLKLKDYDLFNLCLNGSLGIGDFSDNWVITFLDNNKALSLGTRIMLFHPVTNSWLATDLMFFKNTKNSPKQIIFSVKKQDTANEKERSKILEESSKQALEQADAQKDEKNHQTENPDKPIDKPKQNPKTTPSEDIFLNDKIWLPNLVRKFETSEQNLMRTGFKSGAVYERINDDYPNNQAFSIDLVNAGKSNILEPKSDSWQTVVLPKQSFKIKGKYKEPVITIATGSGLEIKPMLQTGVAWLEKSLLLPNQFSLTFQAKVNDASELSVVLGNEISEKYIYKIIIGDSNNSCTKIIKQETRNTDNTNRTLCKIDASQNNFAALTPGQVIPIWIVFNQGIFFLGQSTEIGENIFLAYKDDEFNQNINRLGFSCNTQSIFIADIRVLPPLGIKPPMRMYDQTTPVLNKKNNRGFRVPNECCLQLSCSDLFKEKIILSSEDDSEKYILEIDAPNKKFQISKQDQVQQAASLIFTVENNTLLKRKHKAASLWLSFIKGSFLLGFDEIGKNPAFTFSDPKPLENICTWAMTEQTNVTDIKFFSKILFDFINTDKTEKFKEDNLSNKIIALFPYDYNIIQENEKIIVKDFVTPQNFLVSSAPQKGADYSMMLSIESNGIPKMRWAWQPENADLMNLRWQSMITSSMATALNQGASHFLGSGVIGGLMGAVINMGMTGATIPISTLAAQLKARADKDYGLTADKTLIKNAQNISSKNSITTDIPEKASSNRYLVEKALDAIRTTSPSTRELFFLVLSKCKYCVNLIIHPYVIGSTQIKNNLKNCIDDLISYHAELFEGPDSQEINKPDEKSGLIKIDVSKQEMITLLTTAIQNPYLLDDSSKEDTATKNKWMAVANILFRKIQKQSPEEEVSINPMFGDFFWLETTLPEEGKGKISFSAKGTGTVNIGIANQTGKFAGTSKELYEITFFNYNATTAAIKLSSLGTIAASTNDERLRLNEISPTNYWVSLDQGNMKLGVINEAGEEETVLTYKDPYPLKNETVIGFGTWIGNAEISNIKVLSLVQETNLFKSSPETKISHTSNSEPGYSEDVLEK